MMMYDRGQRPEFPSRTRLVPLFSSVTSRCAVDGVDLIKLLSEQPGRHKAEVVLLAGGGLMAR